MSKKKHRNRSAPEAEGNGGDEGLSAPEKSQLAAPVSSGPTGPEDQKQRWVKYGSNVVLVTLVAVALAVMLTYLAQRSKLRVDTTQTGDHSLKPQTIEILRGLDQPIKIVSLYTEKKAIGGVAVPDQVDYAGRVRDLLEEYKRASNKIDVESIDPEANPGKVDDLIAEVTEKYGGEVKKYREFLDRWPERFKQIRQLAGAEAAQAAALTQQGFQGPVLEAAQSILERTAELESLQTSVDRQLRQRPPNYRGATEAIRDTMEEFGGVLGQIIPIFETVLPKTRPATQPTTGPATQPGGEPATQPSAEADPEAGPRAREVPAPLKEYIVKSLPQYRELKRMADEAVDQIGKLGDLKLDELRQKLRERNAILVLGPDEMRSLSYTDVWQTDPDVRQMLRSGGAPEQMKPRFAGEQQLSTAVLGLTRKKKPRVVFVRGGGPPLTVPMGPFQQRSSPLRRVAERLREYNFEVTEKDLSGMWAMQSRQMGAMMPPQPEPTDAEMKDAVWVVIPTASQQQGMMPSGDMAQRLGAHLDAGGSAMVLAAPRGTDLGPALDKWGVEIHNEAVVVHEEIRNTGGQTGDQIEEIQRIPFVFVMNQYGEHLITRPMRSLDTVVVGSSVIKTKDAPGSKVTPLMTAPGTMKVWGESDISSIDEGNLTYTPVPLGDVPPPILMGAASERQGAGRLVVFGSMQSFMNEIFSIPDPALYQKGYIVSRFPGNFELFMNSVFWLAKMDTMIAISPAAMEVSRIDDMSKGTLGFWRWGVLIVGLPLAVVVAGAMVYMGRRD